MEWHPAGDRYALGRTAGGVVLDLHDRCVGTLKTYGSDIFTIAFNASVRILTNFEINLSVYFLFHRLMQAPQGNVVLHGDRQGVVRSHDLRASQRELRDGSHLPTIKLKSSASCLQLLKDPTYLVTGALQNEVRISPCGHTR